jgi:hypothetical protein
MRRNAVRRKTDCAVSLWTVSLKLAANPVKDTYFPVFLVFSLAVTGRVT